MCHCWDIIGFHHFIKNNKIVLILAIKKKQNFLENSNWNSNKIKYAFSFTLYDALIGFGARPSCGYCYCWVVAGIVAADLLVEYSHSVAQHLTGNGSVHWFSLIFIFHLNKQLEIDFVCIDLVHGFLILFWITVIKFNFKQISDFNLIRIEPHKKFTDKHIQLARQQRRGCIFVLLFSFFSVNLMLSYVYESMKYD